MNWQPIAHRGPGKPCHHARLTRAGWVLDCDEPADFAATDADGATWYACSRHVSDMHTDDE